MDDEVFLDTAFAIALCSETDGFHEAALTLADELEQANTRIVTSRAILLEIGNALAKPAYRLRASRLLNVLEQDGKVTIVEINSSNYQAALTLFRQRNDKTWGLVDCLSFVIMQDRNLRQALTTDRHFEQAGFAAQLR